MSIRNNLQDKNGNELCRGFLLQRIDRDAGEILETRFAKLNDGSMLASQERKCSNEFNPRGTIWSPIATLPEGVEFIGYYHVPKH